MYRLCDGLSRRAKLLPCLETANGVKYFNLQGVRIVNPEKGMMLIRVTPDGKSEKVVL